MIEGICGECKFWEWYDNGRIHTRVGLCKRMPPTDGAAERAMTLKRAVCAWASGVGTMLIAIAIKDQGWEAFEPWTVMGAAGMMALFAKSLED